MKPSRIVRVNELIRRELATQIYRVVHQPDFDPARVTVTHVITAVDLRTARVLVSVRGTPEEQEHALHVLRSLRSEFQQVISHTLDLRYTPRLQFVLDDSIAEGDHVLQLLDNLEASGEIPHIDPAALPGGEKSETSDYSDYSD